MDIHKLAKQVAGPESVNPKTKTRVHIILNAPNSTNGNPRRVSLLLDSDTVLEAKDHGYKGPPKEWGHRSIEIDVGAREYNYWSNRSKGGEA